MAIRGSRSRSRRLRGAAAGPEPRRHDARDRRGALAGIGAVGGGKAVEALGRHVEAREQRAREKEREGAAEQRQRAEQPAERPAAGPDHEARPAAAAFHQRGQDRRRGHRAEDDERDGQRREAAHRRQHLPGEAAEHEGDRHLAAEDDLRGDEHPDVAPRDARARAVPGGGRRGGSCGGGDDRHLPGSERRFWTPATVTRRLRRAPAGQRGFQAAS